MCERVLDKICANTSKSGCDIGWLVGWLLACLISHFMFICSPTRSHWDDIHVTLYLCVCAQFQLCVLIELPFFRSTISCVFLFLFARYGYFENLESLCWSHSYAWKKKAVPQSLLCAENHLRFPHFAFAFFSVPFSTTKKRQISGVFMRCASKIRMHYILWKCENV